MRSSKMATGSGRVAIFHHHHNRDRKKYPKSWLTSFPAPPSWIQDGGATSNVWRTSRCLWRHPWKGSKNVPQTFEVIFFLLFYRLKKKHLIVSLPQRFSKWLRELPACHYGEVDQSARVNTTRHGKLLSMAHGVDFGKHLLYFLFLILCVFFIFLTVLYNSLELLYSTAS